MSFNPVITLTDELGGKNPVERVNAGYVGVGQTSKVYTGTQALSTTLTTTITLETVTAGKIFFITDISVTSNSAAVFLVQITAGGVPIFSAYAKGDTGPISLPGIETQPQATAGQIVNLVISSVASATTAAYVISGVEQ